MSKHQKDKTSAAAPAAKNQELVVDAAAAATKKHDSVVDEVFDAVTAWAAQGLTAAKRGLEASARWLDGTAKVVGELATKLESTSRSSEAAPEASSTTQSA
jgi:hypothetical protein